MSELSLINLEFEGKQARMVGTADEPEWVVADVCDVLGTTDPSKARQNSKESVTFSWRPANYCRRYLWTVLLLTFIAGAISESLSPLARNSAARAGFPFVVPRFRPE